MSLSNKPYRGCRDFFPPLMRAREYLFDVMKKTSAQFAFEPYDGPLLEEVDLYKAKSGEELINEQIYAFVDRGQRNVAIRPEMTPTVSRMVSQVHRETPKPIRWYSIPNLLRYEKPQRGRLREHWQFNADIFGAPQSLGEIEILSLITTLLENYGADKSMFSVQINDRTVVDSIFNNLLQLSPEASYKLYKIIDAAKKMEPQVLQTKIREIVTDEKNANIFEEYLALENFESLEKFLGKNNLNESAQNFLHFLNLAKHMPLFQYLKYDPTIVRGLDYYTGIVFEVFDENPENRRAIAGGGSYANLLQIFNEPPLAGVGFGMGDVTLKDFLETHKLMPDTQTGRYDFFLCYLDEKSEMATFELAKELRSKKMQIEMHLGPVKFNKIAKLSQKNNHTHVGIIGENELAQGEIQVKNMQTNLQAKIKLNNTTEIISFIKN